MIAKLKKGVANADEQTQLEAIEAITDMGATAQVKAELERAAKEDNSPLVRDAAEAALMK